ncbi:MAG: multiheme c-type cytochrome [Planctomycetota bacterium]|nr:multiheme c-type cytochrome [Planctomycetota bacterium]
MKYLAWREIAIACAFCVGMLGCSPTQPSSLHIVVSGDTAGWITPCGCTANQSGGLERRASLLKSIGPSDRIVYLDVGGSAAGKSAYQQVKLTSILLGDQLMGLELHNMGAPETQLAPETLFQIAKETKTQWLSANLQAANANSLLPEALTAYRIIKRAGIRILVTSVVDPNLVKNSLWKTREASLSVLQVLQKEKADIKIVLAYMDEPGLRALAESLPEVDFIVGGPTGQSLSPFRVGPVEILSATNKGKFITRIELQKQDKAWKAVKSGALEVTSTLPLEPAQSKNLEMYLSTLGKLDFSADETGLVASQLAKSANQSDYRIAGSDSCAQCHNQDDQSWHASKHSQAWQTLIDKRSHVDPTCQVCHTTGYGLGGGFVQIAKSMPRVNVGCESCHGPSQAHVLNPKTKTTYLSREQCVRCHDHENSPEFEYGKYWAKIAHGAK